MYVCVLGGTAAAPSRQCDVADRFANSFVTRDAGEAGALVRHSRGRYVFYESWRVEVLPRLDVRWDDRLSDGWLELPRGGSKV